jgi:hypothetical protein
VASTVAYVADYAVVMPKVKVMSGQFAGRFAGPVFSGLATNPAFLDDLPGKVEGIDDFVLYTSDRVATIYTHAKSDDAQARLRALGIESELVY